MNGLQLTLLLLVAAVLAVVAFRRANLPPILGYLVVGMVVGPHAMGLAPDTPATRYLAEFGVVFLMFSIGLEFSLPTLRAMRVQVFGIGTAQVVLTVLIGFVGMLAVKGLLVWAGLSTLGLNWQGALALAGALSMSSTAIISKLLAERLELDRPHGRTIMGVLLFQDLAVVPLLVLVPALSGDPAQLPLALSLALLKAAVLLALLLVVGQRLMRWWFTLIARARSQELFVLNVLLVTLGLAYLTEIAGLSLALGAFVAGMLIAETQYRHQVEEDIKPFRDVLLGLFFVTIGMQLNFEVVLRSWWLVLLLTLLPVLLKFGIVLGVAKLFGQSTGTALRSALALATAGEFGLVLVSLMGRNNLVSDALLQPVLAAMLLSMIATPFIIAASDRIVNRLSSSEWMLASLNLTQIAARSMAAQHPVLIIGFGRCGQNLARLLKLQGMDTMALDLDPDRVREAAAAGESVVFGDGARKEALVAAGIMRASALVIPHAETRGALKVLHHVRELRPELPVIVRTHDDSDLEKLRAAGATEVVPEIIEGSLMLASHALVLLGVPLRKVVHQVQAMRDDRYTLLRGYFRGADDADTDEHTATRLHSVPLAEGAASIGRQLGDVGVELVGAEVAAVRRASGLSLSGAGLHEHLLAAGDVVVLSGAPEALALAEERLLR